MGLALTYPYRKASQDFVSSTAMSSNSIKIAEWKFGGPVTIKCVRASDLQHQKMPVKRPNADVDIRQLRSQLHGKDGVMWIPDAGVYTIERVAPAPGFTDSHFELLPEVETLQRRRLLEQADRVDGPIWAPEVGLNNRRQLERARMPLVEDA